MGRLLALTLALGAAHFSAAAEESTGWGLRPFIGAGYTWGGDTLATANLVPTGGSGPTYVEDISAGAGLDLRVGLSYRFGGSPLTMQVSVAHHIDQHHGLDGRAYFRRVPAELVLQWHTSDRLKIGFGVRRALQAKYLWEGGTCNGSPCPREKEKLDGSTGFILEAEWMATPSWGMKARYVHESYQFQDKSYNDQKYEGNHIGLMTNYYFN